MPGHLARRFQQIAVAIFHAEARKAGYDITPVQYAAIAALSERPGMDQATLAASIGYDRATIGGVVDRLAQKGLVTREVCRNDRRARILHLTDLGTMTLQEISPAVEMAQQRILAGLEASEAQELVRLLGKTISALNDLSRAPYVDPTGQ